MPYRKLSHKRTREETLTIKREHNRSTYFLKPPPIEVGACYGRLKVFEVYLNTTRWRVKADCSCGNVVDASPQQVILGTVKSCGCLRDEYRKTFGERSRQRKTGMDLFAPLGPWPFEGLQPRNYRVILADPPWQQKMRSENGMDRSPEGWSRNRQRENDLAKHYTTMSMEELKALPVLDLAADDCVLLMWAIDPMLPHALQLGAHWGFTYKTVGFYWMKTRKESSPRGKDLPLEDERRFPLGTGYWTRTNPEQCLLFTRGQPQRMDAGVRKLIVAPRREHSRKPDDTHERIQRLVKGPYCELFGRESRPGWDVWGNQQDLFDSTEAA